MPPQRERHTIDSLPPAARAAEPADASLSLARAVAHELRAPLSGISSSAQLLRFRAADDPVIERNVGRILREAERLGRLAAALAEYGRVEPPLRAPGDPDAVWDEVLSANRGLLESRALVLHRTRATPPARCLIDASRLTQLFGDVLANAVEAAPEGTDLSLHTETVDGEWWRCRLRNDGPPVPAETMARLFEPLVTTKPGGTGMGLAVGLRIVREHDGTIALDSAEGRGTTVTITLPEA